MLRNDSGKFALENLTARQMLKRSGLLVSILLCATVTTFASSASFYTQRLDDPKAVYISPSGSDDTTALQHAVNKVQETTRQGIVMLAPGTYHLSDTIYIWPGIRLIGYGATRPVIVLPANTPGFADASHEKFMIFFAGRRPRNGSGTIPDANPGTFYSTLANIDIEVEAGNPGAVAVRAHYAQHCFLAHMDFRLGPALAGIHEGGNVVEDVHFFGGTHAIWTSKPSPGWQFTLIDCSFENQREAAILEHEAGLTLIRPHFLHVPTAVEIEPGWVDELWVKNARLENISGPAFVFGMEKSPRNEINMEGVNCRDVPIFAELRDSGKRIAAPAKIYAVKTFSHGLHYGDIGDVPAIENRFDAAPLTAMPAAAPSDLAPLPTCNTWVNVRDLGAKGDGQTDDTDALRKAIAEHRTIYLPSGFYVVHDTLMLRPDTVLVGLHPGATQIILPDDTPAYAGIGKPKALLEAPKGGSNIVIGIGLYTSGNNPRAVAALWKAGADSMMNDVRFLGGHGTPLPDGSRENPYNNNHTADPNPNRHWDSQYPSLWVTDGGGGTFLDIWTPSTFAQAGMVVSDTETEGRVYQMSSEHHVRNEVEVRNAAHWQFYALQTEEERGESGFALPIEIDSSPRHHFRQFSQLPRDQLVSTVSVGSKGLQFAGHSFSQLPLRQQQQGQFRFLHLRPDPRRGDASTRIRLAGYFGQGATPEREAPLRVVARGAKVERLAGGFFNISGGARRTAR